MKEFAIKINLNEDEMEDIKRLNALTKESVPDLFGNDTLKDTIGFVVRSGFAKELKNLLWAYQKDGKEEGGNT